MSDPIKVTVDGEPVTAEVTLEQVRAYLRRKGWEPPSRVAPIEVWSKGEGPRVSVTMALDQTVRVVAAWEQRHPAAVLREIAGTVEPIETGYTRAARKHADEIEAEAGGRRISFYDALRAAQDARVDAGRTSTQRLADDLYERAAAWLLVAQRLLAKEAGR